jgi:hypothetical protein
MNEGGSLARRRINFLPPPLITACFIWGSGMGRLGCREGQLRCREGQLRCQEEQLRCQEGQLRCQEGQLRCREGQLRCQEGQLRCREGQLRCQEGQLRCRERELENTRKKRLAEWNWQTTPTEKVSSAQDLLLNADLTGNFLKSQCFNH